MKTFIKITLALCFAHLTIPLQAGGKQNEPAMPSAGSAAESLMNFASSSANPTAIQTSADDVQAVPVDPEKAAQEEKAKIARKIRSEKRKQRAYALIKSIGEGFCLWALYETANSFLASLHDTKIDPNAVEDEGNAELTLFRMQNARAANTGSKKARIYAPVVMTALSVFGIQLGMQIFQHLKKGFAKTPDEQKEAAKDENKMNQEANSASKQTA